VISEERADRGFTLVETVVAMTVMSLGLLAALTILDRGTAHSDTATALFMNDDRARGALAGMFDVMTETAIKNVDTSMRVHTALPLTDVASDRFTIPGVSLKQCLSPTCRYHTRQNLSVITDRRHCGFEYCSGALGASVTRGKVVPPSMTSCPFDGSSLSSSARLDGVKFFIPRDDSGTYMAKADGSPQWTGLVFLFPCASPDGLAELRRYDVYTSDLLANTPAANAGWTRFPKLNPSMIDLFDFGTDGTTNGTCDGKVPLTNATSDGTTESFTAATYQGSPVILYTKTLGTTILGLPTYPNRSITVRINLQTGETYFAVDHHDSATVYWTDSRTFTRSPKTLMRGLTEFAVSTQVSDPYNVTTNPRGVSEPNVIRVTVGTSDAKRSDRGEWVHHVDTFQIKARNN
jgi:prepilin-type N-terminal cleavage/methylation domain-containing protein